MLGVRAEPADASGAPEHSEADDGGPTVEAAAHQDDGDVGAKGDQEAAEDAEGATAASATAAGDDGAAE